MNLKLISLVAVLFFASLATACGGDGAQDLSGSAVGGEQPVDPAPGGEDPAPGGEDPSKPADPSVPGGGAVEPGKGGEEEPAPVSGGSGSLEDVVGGIAPTQRVNHQYVADACDNDADCLAALEAYRETIAAQCDGSTVTDACPQNIAAFNTDIPRSQLDAGRVPIGFPSAEDVANSIGAESSAGADDPAASAGDPAAGGEVAPVAPESYDKLVIDLESWASSHDRIAAEFVEGTCTDADCKAALMAVIDYISAGCGDPNIVCPAGADGFTGKPTPEETVSGELGDSFPLTADMVELVRSLKEAPAAP